MGPGMRRDDEIYGGGIHQRLIFYVIPQT